MNRKNKGEAVNAFYDAVLQLKNREECSAFFDDVCTINELSSIAQRFAVARMLRSGKTYLEIAEKTGASTATISRVNRLLADDNHGIEMAAERLKAQEEPNQ